MRHFSKIATKPVIMAGDQKCKMYGRHLKAIEYRSLPAATAEVAISRHMPSFSPGAEKAIGFVERTF